MQSVPTLSSESSYFSVKDAANYLGVNIIVIYQMLKDSDGPPHIRIKNRKKIKPLIRIPKKEFIDWIKQREEKSCTTS